MDQPTGRITDYLLDRGYLTAAQISDALGIQRNAPARRFVDILVEEGFLAAQQLHTLFPRIALLERVVEKELTHFADSFVHERFEARDVIFRQAEVGHKAFVLLSGSVRIFHPGPPELELAVVRPGELFGEIALLDGGPRTASAQASEACEVMVISRPDFMAQVGSQPEIASDLFSLLARRLRQADGLLAAVAGQVASGATLRPVQVHTGP